MRKVSSKDFLKLKFLGDPQISPNGRAVVFTVSEPDKEGDRYTRTLYMHDGSKIKKFTAGPSDSSPRWSPDGTEIAFISKRSEKDGNDLMVISEDGGEARKVAHFEDGIEGAKWLGSETMIALLGTVDRKKDKKDDVHEIEKIPYWFNGEGFVYNRKSQLFTVKKNGAKKQLTEEKGTISAFSPSPDGKMVAFVESLDTEKAPLISDIFVLKIGEKNPKKLTNSGMAIEDIAWSPDSKRIAFTGSDLEKGSFTTERIHVVDLKGKVKKVSDVDLSKHNTVNSDSRIGSPSVFVWIGEWIYFTVTDGPTAKVLRTKAGKSEEVIGGDRVIDGFTISGKGEMAFLAMGADYLDELYVVKNGKEKKVSRFNDNTLGSLRLSKPEPFKVKTSDGRKVDAWIMKPVDFDPKKKYPAVLEIHGGPKTAYGYGFSLEFQLLASNGYAVIFSNPLGSDGYGEEFANIHGIYGKRDYEDIMEVMDEAVGRFDFIDAKKLGVTGGSYGGYMTNWIVTQTDRFKAAVTQRSISNWTSFFGTTDIGYFFGPDQLGGDPWTNPEGYAEMSPITHVKNVKTPLLLIHSMEDYRCWMAEAFQFFTALRYLGKEAKLALFPSETHELSRSGKPAHRMKRLELILGWFERYLKESKS